MLGKVFNTYKYQNLNNSQNKQKVSFKGGFNYKTLEIKGKETSAKIFTNNIEYKAWFYNLVY